MQAFYNQWTCNFKAKQFLNRVNTANSKRENGLLSEATPILKRRKEKQGKPFIDQTLFFYFLSLFVILSTVSRIVCKRTIQVLIEVDLMVGDRRWSRPNTISDIDLFSQSRRRPGT